MLNSDLLIGTKHAEGLPRISCTAPKRKGEQRSQLSLNKGSSRRVHFTEFPIKKLFNIEE